MSYYLKVQEDNGNSVAELADSLVHRFGVEDALRVCRENSWEGVMAFIQGRLNKLIQS